VGEGQGDTPCPPAEGSQPPAPPPGTNQTGWKPVGVRRLLQSTGPAEQVQEVALATRRRGDPAPQPQARMWGRRAWGMWRSDGDSHWEVEEFFWEEVGRAR